MRGQANVGQTTRKFSRPFRWLAAEALVKGRLRKGLLCSLALLAGGGSSILAQPGPLTGGPSWGGPAASFTPASRMAPPPAPVGALDVQPGYIVEDEAEPGMASTVPPQQPRTTAVNRRDPLYADVGAELTPIYPTLVDGVGPACGPNCVAPDFTPPRPRSDRWWVSADALAGWVRGGPTVPFVTTGSTADPSPGAIGQPGTVVLFGDQNLDTIRVGFRAGAGYWLDDERRHSLDIGGFYLLPSRQRYNIASDGAGNPLLIRPVFDAFNQQEVGFLIAQQGIASGSSQVSTRSEVFGYEANLRRYHTWSSAVRTEALVGFRAVRLDESITVTDQVNPLVPNLLTFQGNFVNAPNRLEDLDRFGASNRFYGVQVGGAAHLQHSWCFLDLFGKVGLGSTEQVVSINGQTNLVAPDGSRTVAPGGILAQTTNIGRFERYVFGVIPEAGFNVGVDAFQHVRLRVGYSVLYWNNVVRPGDQIDRGVNPRIVPSDQSFGNGGGPARPAFAFNDAGFWVQSINLGLEFHY